MPVTFPYACSQMQIFFYNSDDFDSLNSAIKERRIIAVMAVFFQVRILFFAVSITQKWISLQFIRIFTDQHALEVTNC